MNYITDEFKEKLESIFPEDKVNELMETFNRKIFEEKQVQDEMNRKFEWSYSSSPKDLNISIVNDEKDRNVFHVVIDENNKRQVLDLNLKSASILYKGIRSIIDHSIEKESSMKKKINRFDRTLGFFSRRNMW